MAGVVLLNVFLRVCILREHEIFLVAVLPIFRNVLFRLILFGALLRTLVVGKDGEVVL